MKYTAKISQAQYVGSVLIDPKGGDLTEKQATEIKKDPWGKELIRKEVLCIDGVKPTDIKDEPKKGLGLPQKAAPKTDTGVNVDLNQGGDKK
jgi:hypothetical protein